MAGQPILPQGLAGKSHLRRAWPQENPRPARQQGAGRCRQRHADVTQKVHHGGLPKRPQTPQGDKPVASTPRITASIPPQPGWPSQDALSQRPLDDHEHADLLHFSQPGTALPPLQNRRRTCPTRRLDACPALQSTPALPALRATLPALSGVVAGAPVRRLLPVRCRRSIQLQ